jgi:Transposase DDE domain group 1
MVVGGAGTQVVAHAGLHALGRFADKIGVGAALSPAFPWTGERAPGHDRGKVLTHVMLMLTGGGESCADIEHLRIQDELFGDVCSDSTMHRTFHQITPTILTDLTARFATVRKRMWAQLPVVAGDGMIVLDIDASLVTIHSEKKEETAPNYKGGFGFHPLLCFADATGDTLAALLRPGNAGSNTVTDHLTVLDDAVAQLPADIAAGHRVGDNKDTVTRRVQVRADSAGCTEGFLKGCRERNIGFAVVARTNSRIQSAIQKIQTFETTSNEHWQPAQRAKGDTAVRSHVAEITSLVDLTDMPAGTRLIVRRERLHPGAQRSLLPCTFWRYWGHFTDNPDGTPVELDAHMRAHAHVEDHIKRLKESGLERFPFTKIGANRAWLQTVCMAADLVRWFQLLCCTGPLVNAQPKRMRWTFWHAPARIIRRARQHIIRIIDGWPTTNDIMDAHRRLTLLC